MIQHELLASSFSSVRIRTDWQLVAQAFSCCCCYLQTSVNWAENGHLTAGIRRHGGPQTLPVSRQ